MTIHARFGDTPVSYSWDTGWECTDAALKERLDFTTSVQPAPDRYVPNPELWVVAYAAVLLGGTLVEPAPEPVEDGVVY